MDEKIERLAEQKIAPNGKKYLSMSTHATYQIASQSNHSLRNVEIDTLKKQIIPEKYQRNIGTVGIEGQIKLLESQVAIVGLGGLGGVVLELLARIGVGKIVVIDNDRFSDSNLNRQLLSNFSTLENLKVEAAEDRVAKVNPAIEINAYPIVAQEKNLTNMLQGSQVVVDGLDNIQVRFTLEKVSKMMGIPLVHGAIAGFLGQVMTVFPEDEGLKLIYGPRDHSEPGIESEIGTPCITPTMVASFQVSEVIKILLGWKKNTLRNRVLFVDMKELVIDIIDFDETNEDA